MDYYVQAYITRLSTEKLEEFLCQCERNGETEAYGYIIPDIRKLLEKRKEKKKIKCLPNWQALFAYFFATRLVVIRSASLPKTFSIMT